MIPTLAQTLEKEARRLQELIERVTVRKDSMKDSAKEFANAASHFHGVVEKDPDSEHIMNKA